MRNLSAIIAACLIAGQAWPAPSLVEQIHDGVYLVYDDTGDWGGVTNGRTHQCSHEYQARKVLDLSDVPAEVWEATRTVRLSFYTGIVDYSAVADPPADGLDEEFEIVINGSVHRFPDDCGLPRYVHSASPEMTWYDMPFPKAEFTRGPNEIILRKAPGEGQDDYLYVGIATGRSRGNSSVTFDGETWTDERLTIPGGTGEYMVRLYLVTRDLKAGFTWRPGAPTPKDDPHNLILYAGARDGAAGQRGLRVPAGTQARVEWRHRVIDPLEPLTVEIDASAPFERAWLAADGEPGEADVVSGHHVERLPPTFGAPHPGGIVITARDEDTVIRSVKLDSGLVFRPVPEPIDMCPPVAPPAGRAAGRPPACRTDGDEVVLENAHLRCHFRQGERLALTSLYNEHAAAEMLHGDPNLFVVEIDGKWHTGRNNFRLQSLQTAEDGFDALLLLDDPAVAADFSARIEEEGLRLSLTLANRGPEALSMKVVFPHLEGLGVSESAADDYYFYPWGGGIIADRPAHIRAGYGDHAAYYQVMDLFSPERGAGLSMRIDDADGRHKVLALRKHVSGVDEVNADVVRRDITTREQYYPIDSLEAVPGTGLACEYMARTREPGGKFSPADGVLSAHPGDWHAPMERYAQWAHEVWQFRPYPSPMTHVVNWLSMGTRLNNTVLFRDGAYRTDLVNPKVDALELWCWWEWSELGPWRTPMDRVPEVLGEAAWERMQRYLVEDPVTGKVMYPLNRGDYDGYNERWGGLPALQDAIRAHQEAGALLTLYTDPMLACDTTKLGQAHGREWAVVGPDGEARKDYHSWRMCLDVAQYRDYVAETMGRVLRETSADGIRLDEYGHRGYVCFSDLHEHTFAEPGTKEWMRALSESCRTVRGAMDEVNPGAVLTTEMPGYDFMMQFLDGCITYDFSMQASPLRPVEVNLQRFYFPECRPFELDHQVRDPECLRKLWNAVGSFGRYYPEHLRRILQQNADAFESRNCTPLVPTERPRVYANRFEGDAKTVWTIINATGHTVDGPVLTVDVSDDSHLFSLLDGRDIAIDRDGHAGHALSLYLGPDDIACVALLPRLLDVRPEPGALAVSVDGPVGGLDVAVCDRVGGPLLARPLTQGETLIALADLPQDRVAASIKLLRGGVLLDAREIPD